jgi:hypothetical protein
MMWRRLSAGELCRSAEGPRLNGNRSPQALVEHMENDWLVLWGWDPGQGRASVPILHQEFVDLLKVWVAARSVCTT